MKNLKDIDNQIRLIQEALGEITEYLGSTLRNPISISQFCIDMGFSLEDKEKMQIAFSRIADEPSIHNLSINDFREIVNEIRPSELGCPYSDDMIVGLLNGYARIIPELSPIIKELE